MSNGLYCPIIFLFCDVINTYCNIIQNNGFIPCITHLFSYPIFDLYISGSFAELKCSPAKAKKPHHRPKNAREFAEKYMQGFYSAVHDEEDCNTDEKSHK